MLWKEATLSDWRQPRITLAQSVSRRRFESDPSQWKSWEVNSHVDVQEIPSTSGGMILTGENKVLGETPCHSATLYTTNPTRNGLGLCPDLRGEGLTPKCLSEHNTVHTSRGIPQYQINTFQIKLSTFHRRAARLPKLRTSIWWVEAQLYAVCFYRR